MADEEQLAPLIEESIKLELRVADLYFLFHNIFRDDADFWWQLTLEEKNHAALIRSGRENFLPMGAFPRQMVADSLENLREMIQQVDGLLSEYARRSPSREEAFNVAYKLENSAGELHYQNFVQRPIDSGLDLIFQKLNRDDRDHAIRISAYMKTNKIVLDRQEA